MTIFLIISLDIPFPYLLYLVKTFKCNTDGVDNRYCCFFFVFWRNEFVVVASMPHLGAALFIILAQNLWWIVYIVLGKWFAWKIDLLCKQSGLLLSAATTSCSHSKLKLPMCRAGKRSPVSLIFHSMNLRKIDVKWISVTKICLWKNVSFE